jgi:curved DNA-binding protein
MAVTFRDYYETLGLSRGATDEQIRNAYRKLARKYHPDVNPGKKDAEEKFKEINEAYSVLSDPQKRKQYDELGQNWKAGADFRPPPDWGRDVRVEFGDLGGGLGDFSEFFESVFGGARRGAGTRGAGFATRGRDLEAQLRIPLEEAHRGTIRTVTLRGPDGKHKSIRVNIPAGVSDGELIHIPNEGVAGARGAPPGDLFVSVRLEPHPLFKILDDGNLEMNLPVAPWEAALGARVRVPTLDGPVELTIPPNTQNGQRLRLRGQGMARRGGGRGDLYVRIQIVNPPSLSPKERELFERLASESRFDPRQFLAGKK